MNEKELARKYLDSLHCPCRSRNSKEKCFELAYNNTYRHVQQHNNNNNNNNCLEWIIKCITSSEEPPLCCKQNIDKHVREEKLKLQYNVNIAKLSYKLYLSKLQSRKNKIQKTKLIKSNDGYVRLYVDGIIYVNPTQDLLDEYNIST